MSAGQLPRQRTGVAPLGAPDDRSGFLWERGVSSRGLTAYREVLVAFLASHRRVSVRNGPTLCTCGRWWPCAAEWRAAELLDWLD